jgi:hypothetical protein
LILHIIVCPKTHLPPYLWAGHVCVENLHLLYFVWSLEIVRPLHLFLTYQTRIFMRTFLLFQSILQVSHFSFATKNVGLHLCHLSIQKSINRPK